MTREEAIAHQNELVAKHYELGWWYGTDCTKCCDVYPKIKKTGSYDKNDCYFECEVCGKRTALYTMPWLAKEAWNNGEFVVADHQLSLF